MSAATKRGKNLYELTEEWQEIQDEIEDRGGELDEELLARMEAIEGGRTRKVEAYCKLIRHAESTAETIEAEIRRLKARGEACRKIEERLKQNLKISMEAAGEQRLEAGPFKVRIQRNSGPSVELPSGRADDIPHQYMRIEVRLNKAAVIEDWKAGVEIPETLRIVEGTHIRIQ